MAPTSREGRGETTGPAGTRADKSIGSGGVEATGSTTYDRTPPPPPPPVAPKKPVQIYLTTPVVYDLRSNKKRRKRKKYSRGLKTVQRTEDGLTLAGRRFGDALESGFRTYRRRRNKSARRKKDGAIRDILPNTGNGVSRFLNVGSDIPYDITRKVNSRKLGKQIRDSVRFFTLPFFR